MTSQLTETRERRVHELPNGQVEVRLHLMGDKVRLENTYRYPTGNTGTNTDEWQRCNVPGCYGEAALEGSPCCAHLPAENRRQWLQSLAGRTDSVRMRGIDLGNILFQELLSSAVFEDGTPRCQIFMTAADISADIRFNKKHLHHGLILNSARFFGAFYFEDCTFDNSPDLTFAAFDTGGPVGFNRCTFAGGLRLSNASANERKNGSIGLTECECGGLVEADGVSVSLNFVRSSLMKGLSIRDAKMEFISVDHSIIKGELNVAGTKCRGFSGDGLVTQSANKFGPVSVDNARFNFSQMKAPLHFDIECKRIDLTGARFEEGGAIDCSSGELVLDRVTLGGTLRVSGRSTETELPRVIGLRDSDAGSMSFDLVDMSRCLFFGAHNLGNVTIGPTVQFQSAPHGTRRTCIVDEFAWRAHFDNGLAKGWQQAGTRIGEAKRRDPEDQQRVQLPPLTAGQVAGTYRELRRSLEAHLDAPRAADFYYGEMEMRRRSHTGPLWDRAIVTLYWLLSGYGLSVGKAVRALAFLVGVGSIGFCLVGYTVPPATPADAILVAVQATLPGFEPPASLSNQGQWIRTALRIVGPLMYALLLLSIRSRVVRKP